MMQPCLMPPACHLFSPAEQPDAEDQRAGHTGPAGQGAPPHLAKVFVRGTKEMVQPCLIDLHVISLVRN